MRVFGPADTPGAAWGGSRQSLEWTVLNYEALERLHQPPYGARAVVLRGSSELIGAVGYCSCLLPLDVLPPFQQGTLAIGNVPRTLEFELLYFFRPGFQRHGYATEAVRALIDYAFGTLNVKRIVAATDFDNDRSIRLMERVGMTIGRNPSNEPEWRQVVGVLEHPSVGSSGP